MAELGSICIQIALALAVYAVVGAVLWKLRKAPQFLESARRATYLIPAVLAVAVFSMVRAFLYHDFQIRYVAEHSNMAMNPAYTWVAIYAGNEGSLLYIAFVLAALAALAIAKMPRSMIDGLPYTIIILMSVLIFFLGLMVTLANPFDLLPFIPPDGQGINPLLTHPGMFIHPPLLMAGLIGMTVPFAIAIGMLLTGKITDHWVDFGRAWGLVIWAILGVGLLLGAWWAYTILGWGGYWAWDPIENVALMPWLALTAFVHSIMAQKRRGMFRMWNIVLISIAFTLALFGIFINRGGPVPSVHSFASSTLGWVFLGFLCLSLVFSFVVFLLRYKSLRRAATLESTLSREAAFLLNNLLLLCVAFVTLWGVVYPLISQMFRGITVTVAAPFYNQLNGPLLMTLVFLMGIGPLIPWRKGSISTLLKAARVPGLVGVLVFLALFIFGIDKPFALVSFALCGFVTASILQEWVRGTVVRHRRGESYPVALLRLILANRPRYGGYIVHLAMVFLALGITGSSFYSVQRDIILAPGQKVNLNNYSIEYVGAREMVKDDRIEFFNDMKVQIDAGTELIMTTWRAYYPDLRIASTRAAIRSTPLEDLYIVSSESMEDGSGVFRIMVKPLVWWMWLAGPVLILGTVVALWPERRRYLGDGLVSKKISTDPVESY